MSRRAGTGESESDEMLSSDGLQSDIESGKMKANSI